MAFKSGGQLLRAMGGLARRACAAATATNNGGRIKLVKKAFTLPQTWTAPASTAWVNDLIGSGGTGTPGETVTLYNYDTYKEETTTYDNASWGTDSTTGQVYQGTTSISSPSEVPAGYCNDVYTSVLHKTVSTCYYYYLNSWDETTPATNGGTTTAFGESFLGGAGGPPTAREAGRVTVTPGSSYYIDVVYGGSVSFSYYE